MTGYIKALRAHLTEYKKSSLGVEAAGIFKHRGEEIPYGHILPKDLKWLNILEPHRKEIQLYIDTHADVKLHKFFHHLNSSQALALNLFFPFFESGQIESAALIRALGLEGTISSWKPELVPDAVEGTNVDVSWQKTDGHWTYCEVKLSEAEFGTTKCDPRHLEKLNKIYGPTLQPYCPARLLQPAAFFDHYQIFRNVWLAARDPKATVVFLLPRRNEPLWGPLCEVVSSLETSLRIRIHLTALEDVIENLTKDKSCPPKMSRYAWLLSEKYVLPKFDAHP